MVEEIQDKEFSEGVFQQFMGLYIIPEVQRRQNTGELLKPFNLRAAQIICFPDGRKPQVRINSEVKAIGKVKIKPEITKKYGELIFEHEVDGLEEINLTKKDDPDCGHATLLRINNRWTIVFDFRYNKALSEKHIEIAQQFYKSAQFSLKLKYWASFVDNLFSASELLAKSMLLSLPDSKFREKTTHPAIQIRYNKFADLGNAKIEYKNTFNKLSGLRTPARYLKGNFSIREEDARIYLETIKDMIEDAKLRIKS